MDPHPQYDALREFERARDCLATDNSLAAMGHLEKSLKAEDNPLLYSYLGYCIAKERGQFRKGIELCRSSLEAEPDNPVHFLHLGKIQLLTGEKEDAISTMREGMARGGNEELERILYEIGTRKPPVISFLDRDNPLNKFLGILLGKIGLR